MQTTTLEQLNHPLVIHFFEHVKTEQSGMTAIEQFKRYHRFTSKTAEEFEHKMNSVFTKQKD